MRSSSSDWSDTLQAYLARTNEDEVTIQSVASTVMPRLVGRPDVTWIDVGCGPGTKTFGVLRILEALGGDRLNAYALEPDARWERRFEGERARSVTLGCLTANLVRFLCEPLSFVRVLLQEVRGFVLVTCFHVLYDERVIADMAALLSFLRDAKRPAIVYISIEAPESDFFVIRQRLEQNDFRVPSLAAPIIEGVLAETEVSFERVSLTGQYCKIELEDYDWLLPFLMGIGLDHWQSLPGSVRVSALSVVRREVDERSGLLSIPDVAYAIKTG